MTKEELLEYRVIEKRIESLQKKIDRMEAHRPTVSAGKVKGSSPVFPYQPISYTVSGPERYEEYMRWLEKMKNHQQQLRYAQQALEQVWLDIDEFIETLSDESNKLIFTYIFLDGMKQEEVADKLGLEQSTISKRISSCLRRFDGHD